MIRKKGGFDRVFRRWLAIVDGRRRRARIGTRWFRRAELPGILIGGTRRVELGGRPNVVLPKGHSP